MARYAMALMVLLSSCGGSVCEVAFVETIIHSVARNTELHRKWLNASDITNVAKSRGLMSEPHQVLIDETWGVYEFGYCFASGAFAYITIAKKGQCPKSLSMQIYEPDLLRAKDMCGVQ